MSSNPCHDDDSQIFSKIGEKLYLKPEKADVYFLIESTGERIPAHKILLSSGSDVFEAMFYGSLKEEGDIIIVDASAEAFIEFLRFFYFNKVELSMENVSEVMYLGKKYDVKDCLRLCANLLTNKITVGNVISALGLAIIYDQIQLQKSCESEIGSNSKEVLQSLGFLGCDRRVLNIILKMDRFSCSETEVFEACMAWVKTTSKQDGLTRDIIQTHLGDLFYEIRFVSMSLDEFAKLLPSYGKLFSADEYNEILQVITQQESNPKMFKGGRRLPILYSWDEQNVIKCNRFARYSNPSDIYQIQSEEVTTFSTNTPLLLGHFVMYVVPVIDALLPRVSNIKQIHATILANSNDTQTQFSFDYRHDSVGVIVKLPNPVIIKPGIIYKILLSFPSTECYAWGQLKSTVNLEHGIVAQFFDDCKINGNIGGVIRELGFNLLK